MIEINVNEDMRHFEPAIAGPFTIKQIPFVAVAIVLAFVAKEIAGTVFEGSDEAMAGLVLLLAGPPIVLGFGKKNGMPMTKYLRYVFQSEFIFPKFRKYKIDNPISRLKNYENEPEDKPEMGKKGKTKVKTKAKKAKPSKTRKAEIARHPELQAYK